MPLPGKESKHSFIVFRLALVVWYWVCEVLWLAVPLVSQGKGVAMVEDGEGRDYGFAAGLGIVSSRP